MGMSVMARTEGGPNCDIRMALILTSRVSSLFARWAGEAGLQLEVGDLFSHVTRGCFLTWWF